MFGRDSNSGGSDSWLRESGWGNGWEQEGEGGSSSSSSRNDLSWWDQTKPQPQPTHPDGDAAPASSESDSTTLSSSAWRLETPPALKAPFKPPARVTSGIGRSSTAGAAAAASSVRASAAAGAGHTAAGASSAARAASASAPSASPLLKPIRFVQAKQTFQLEGEQTQQTSAPASQTGAAAATAITTTAITTNVAGSKAAQSNSDAPGVVRVAGRVSLLSRSAPPAASRLRSTAPSLRAAPSLLAPFKKPGAAPTVAAAAAAASVTPSAGRAAASSSAGPNSSLALAHVFSCSFCPAGRKKKNWKEGYLHLFRSAIAAAPTAAGTSGSASATASAAASPASRAVKPASFLKSHLYSERGHLVDEQIGSSVMQYEEATTRPAKSALQRMGWDDSFCGGGGKKNRKRRRGDEVDDDDDDDSDDDDADDASGGLWGPSNPALSSGTGAASAAPSPLLANTFAQGEVVILGRFECQIEEEISYEEFDKSKKLLTGELTAAPLSRFSRQTSIAVTGPPLPPDNRGHILLSAMGLAANGGVIGRNERAAQAIKEPIALVWHVRDSRPGIGFKEKPRLVAPPSQRGGGRGGRGGGRRF